MYHPHYVFGRVGNKYKSFGLTHTPKPEYKSISLSKNPNPQDDRKSYLQMKVMTSRVKDLEHRLPGWNFSKEDHGIVRHYKKTYRANRKHRKSGRK